VVAVVTERNLDWLAAVLAVLIEPAKLKPSHLRNNDCPKVGSRST
jgi:hypothetical protein